MRWVRWFILYSAVVCTFGCVQRSYIDIYLAVSEQGLNSSPFSPHLLRLFHPRFTKCSYCVEVKITASDGETVTVLAEPKPRLRLSRDQIDKVWLSESPTLDPKIRYWVASAVPTMKARPLVNTLRTAYPFDKVLVKLRGKATSVDYTALWSQGIRLGIFKEKRELQQFADNLGVRTVWVPFDEKAYNLAIQKRLDEIAKKRGLPSRKLAPIGGR